jgi:hypothetical protein
MSTIRLQETHLLVCSSLKTWFSHLQKHGLKQGETGKCGVWTLCVNTIVFVTNIFFCRFRFLQEVKEQFFRNGSPLELPNELKKQAGRYFTADFSETQKIVAEPLRCYW